MCRYIHQNPLKAGIARVEEYEWSSFNEYLESEKIINTEQVMKIFGNNYKEARANFVAFHNVEVENNDASDLLEYEIRTKLTDEEVRKYIGKILKVDEIINLRRMNTKYRDEKLKKLKELKGTSIAQISRVIGISKKIIERAMKEK